MATGNPGTPIQDLHIHLQNLVNQGTIVLAMATTDVSGADTEITKIGFWNDCIIKERNENIYTFFKRTPSLPTRRWQDDFMASLPTMTTYVKSVTDFPSITPEGHLITDLSGYLLGKPGSVLIPNEN